MSLQDIIDEENLLQSFIDKLLDKKEDEKLDIEIYGHPANWLDDPRKIKRPIAKAISEGKYCSFEIVRLFKSGAIVNTYDDAPAYLLDFRIGKVFINRSRMRLLLDYYDSNAYTVIDGDRYSLFVSIPITMIVKHAYKITAP